jgi:hypothetical protein
MATAEMNKDTLRRVTQAFNEQDREAWDACFGDPCRTIWRPETRT